jgi:hypothetical protein
MVNLILNKYFDTPGPQDEAVRTFLQQAELLYSDRIG